MARLIDLDELAGPDIEVKLDGKVYRLPADCPVELWLAITDPPEDIEGNRAQFEYLSGKVLQLFQIRQPQLESLSIGLAQLMNVVMLAYSTQSDKEGDTERPTTRRTRGATSSKPASQPRGKTSRSR